MKNTSTTPSHKAGSRRTKREAVAKRKRKRAADHRTLANTSFLTYLTVKQAAAHYGVSETTIRRRVDAGTLQARHEGSRLLVART